VNFSPQTAEMK